MGDTVSAVPSALTGWAAWAQAQNPTVTSAARRADAAIQAFNSSKHDPAVFTHPVPYPGENVVSYTARNGTVDQWVGKVGEAFFAIATKNVPPAALQYESSYYSNKRISADEKAVEQQVGDDPVAQARAAGDAAEMHEAIDRKDGGTVRQMANGLAPYVQKGDRAYLAAYYKDLGPDYTVKATHYMDDLEDPAQAAALRTFDQGLVTATNQRGWDPSFENRIFAQGTMDHPADPHKFLLLAYPNAPHAASYAQHFLETAGDAYFFQDPNAPKLPDTRVGGPESANWVLHAISLNRSAAADWLTGHPPGEQGQETTRLQALIVGPASLSGVLQMGHNEQAVNDLIAAAGAPDGGRSRQLLNLFASLPPQMVADGYKPGIARAVGENIPTLMHAPKDVRERILQFATKNPDGSPNDAAALEIAKGAGTYLGTLLDNHEMIAKNLYEVGGPAREFLTFLHEDLHQIDEDDEHAKELQKTILFGALDLAPIPGLKEGAEAAVDAGKSIAIRATEFYQSTHKGAPDPRGQIDFAVQSLIARQYVGLHPDLVAHGQDADDVAVRLAHGDEAEVPGREHFDEHQQQEMYEFLNFVRGVHPEGGE